MAEKTGTSNGKVNIVPEFVEPSDMTEMKRIAGVLGVGTILFPDTSGKAPALVGCKSCLNQLRK
jgi:nitrogenase molybdenum-iron protein beta chain